MRAHHLQDTALRYFLEVVRSGSLAVASERLHVAASAISRQISGLEQALDTVLFERQPRGMVPTPAGEILAAHARRSSMDADRVLEDLDALRGARQGRVRIASAEGFASHFLPPLIVEFRRVHERMVFDVAVVAPGEVPARLRAGDADIGLTFSRTPEKDIRVEHQQPAPILALMRPDHPLAAARSLTLARLCEYPVALPAPDTTLRQMIDIACSRQQIDLQPMLTCNTVAVLHGFVLEGGGLTVSGEVSARHWVASGQMVAVPLRDRGLDLRDIQLQTLAARTLPHGAQRFLDFLKQRLPERLQASRRRGG
ncbi:MAG: LysR family transcriptional regulator [Aquincola sp.]|uniref:LysR family transcriptional regulator n=1 Tax=uncultured Aquincola sp. TaxID=886556 RepID=UPI0032B2553E|nr:LysR family transcriptional regulator [Aquincola sp.]